MSENNPFDSESETNPFYCDSKNPFFSDSADSDIPSDKEECIAKPEVTLKEISESLNPFSIYTETESSEEDEENSSELTQLLSKSRNEPYSKPSKLVTEIIAPDDPNAKISSTGHIYPTLGRIQETGHATSGRGQESGYATNGRGQESGYATSGRGHPSMATVTSGGRSVAGAAPSTITWSDKWRGAAKGTRPHGPLDDIRHRKHDDDRMSGGTRCCFGMLMLVAQVLLHGVMALTLYWIIQYHSKTYEDGSLRPFAWREDPDLEWNMHPVLMVAGFIYFMGEAMLMYRTCRCCRRIWTKLLHSIFHILAIPCIAMGFLAAWDYHSLKKPTPIPHFYSLHSWLGLATMGLFVLQFVVGFFSFLLLLCCESATASFRAALVPVHSTFGTTTFLLAIATCVAGLTEKAYFTLSEKITLEGKPFYSNLGGLYENLSEEAIFINTIGACLIGLAILVPCLVRCESFRKGLPREGFVDAHL